MKTEIEWSGFRVGGWGSMRIKFQLPGHEARSHLLALSQNLHAFPIGLRPVKLTVGGIEVVNSRPGTFPWLLPGFPCEFPGQQVSTQDRRSGDGHMRLRPGRIIGRPFPLPMSTVGRATRTHAKCRPGNDG
jgi:hypothetical protein